MTPRNGAAGPVLAASPATRRELRPRQASGARGLPAGATSHSAAPRASGRVTRSSALSGQTNPSLSSSAPPQPLSIRTSSRSHKRSSSPGASAIRRQPKRARHRLGVYDEDSDSEEDSDHASISQDSDSDVGPREARKAGFKTPSLAQTTPRRLGRSAAENSPLSLKSKPLIEDEIIPDWPSLPFHVLVQVFRYAGAGLFESGRGKWLLAASLVCRAFAEPALTALYESPPLSTRSMAHGLLSLLSKDPSTTLFNYRSKVEELLIDVGEIASRTHKGQLLDLKTLVINLPRLKYLEFFHEKDEAPYRRLDDNLRWHYPTSLFEALSGMRSSTEKACGVKPIKLAGWHWNRRLMGSDLDLSGIKRFHQAPSFSNLKKVSFLNYQVPSLHAKASADQAELAALDRSFIQSIADAITALPVLEHLSFESSTAVNDQLLPLLPKSLKVLELVNCWDVTSEDFATYLLLSGHNLKQLILHHNQSLSLAFLTVLGPACPKLQRLCMDFKCFKHHEFYRDSDPNYETLLEVGEVPKWPESLETLELRNMRKWTAEPAETLFQSLVDSAPQLLKLRRLDLKAMLNIPYRQRSQIRDKWEAKLKQVFLRKKEDPLPFFSLRHAPLRQADNDAIKTPSMRSRKSSRAMVAESPSRRSSRIAMQVSSPSSRASSVGRDLRRHGLGRPSYAEPDTDADEESDEGDRPSMSPDGQTQSQPAFPTTLGETAPFRHGMCEKVELQLDNQKPAEQTFAMEDFVDDEEDDLSDDDWVGDVDNEDVGYAW